MSPDGQISAMNVCVNHLFKKFEEPDIFTFRSNKVQRLVDVSDLVETHLAAVGLGQGLAGDHLQQ